MITKQGKKISPRSKRLRQLMLDYEVSNLQLTEALGLSKGNTTVTRLLTGKCLELKLDVLVRIANVFHVGITDIYNTRCVVDEENRAKLLTLNAILDNTIILGKLRKLFNIEDCKYLVEMLKNYELEKAVMPKHFLVNSILEADYYSDLQSRFMVKPELLADKIDELNELEAFTLLSRILNYNSKNEVIIDKLFYKESKNEKRCKIKSL